MDSTQAPSLTNSVTLSRFLGRHPPTLHFFTSQLGDRKGFAETDCLVSGCLSPCALISPDESEDNNDGTCHTGSEGQRQDGVCRDARTVLVHRYWSHTAATDAVHVSGPLYWSQGSNRVIRVAGRDSGKVKCMCYLSAFAF